MRTIIELPESQIEALRAIEIRQNVSRAELVRQAVAEYVVTHAKADPAEAFGAWVRASTGKPSARRDGVAVQRKLRAEWDK